MKESIKKKFDSIDKSKIKVESTKEFLGKLEKGLNSKTQENVDKAEALLDKFITQAKAKNADIFVSNKPAPTLTPTAKKKATQVVKSKLDSLMDTIANDPLLKDFNNSRRTKGGGKSDPLIDSERKAIQSGPRVSKQGWKNQYGKSTGGRKYYEYRENRIDRKAPNYGSRPWLEEGGFIHPSDANADKYVVVEIKADGSRREHNNFGDLETARMFASLKREFLPKGSQLMIEDKNGKNLYRSFKSGGYMADGGELTEKDYEMAFAPRYLDGQDFAKISDKINKEYLAKDRKSGVHDKFTKYWYSGGREKAIAKYGEDESKAWEESYEDFKEDFYKMAKGGYVDIEAQLIKELQKLQRDLNSDRLSTYKEGDNSDEEKARKRERESKLVRFNEILELLHEIQAKKMEHGGKIDESTAMVLSQNKAIAHHTEELKKAISKNEKVEPWVIGKMQRATTDMSDVTHYFDGMTEYAKGGRLKEFKVGDKVIYALNGKWFTRNKQNFKSGEITKVEVINGVKVYTIEFKNRFGILIDTQKTNNTKEIEIDQDEEMANGGMMADGAMTNDGIGFIPMDLEQKLMITAKWGGTDIKGVIGILNAMIDSNITDEDLLPKPTKSGSAFEKAVAKKTQEIWAKIEPNYKGNFIGNKYYGTIRELVERSTTSDEILKRYKPFRKYQKNSVASNLKMANGGMMADGGKVRWQDVYVGDNALVIAENKMGMVVKPYGRRFHLKFPDGSEKTYSAEELEFFKDEEFAKGGYTNKRNVLSLVVKNPNKNGIKKYLSINPKDFLDGLHEYAKGGKLTDDYTYIKRSEVEHVIYRDSNGKEQLDFKPKNGFWVSKKALVDAGMNETKAKFDAKEVANELTALSNKAWDTLSIQSGSEIYASDDLQENLADEYRKVGIDKIYGQLTQPERKKVSAVLTDENEHSLRNYLALRGYNGEAEFKNYAKMYDESFAKFGYRSNWNPKNVDLKLGSFAKGGMMAKGGTIADGGKLPEDMGRYFIKTSKTKVVNMSDLIPLRKRATGIANAEKNMKMAYDGEMDKRKPITIYKSQRKYRIMDGNSTYAVAKANGWETIWAEIVKNPNMKNGLKRTDDIFSRAKSIRKEGEAWKDALQRAKTMK